MCIRDRTQGGLTGLVHGADASAEEVIVSMERMRAIEAIDPVQRIAVVQAGVTLQALWTMAREKLDVTTVIYANRSYAILNYELYRVGVTSVGENARSTLDLHNPEMNWTQIASGLGVEASRATTAEEFAAQYESAMKHRGPRLIEAMI